MKPYIRKLKNVGKINIWRVDGTYVRNNLDVNFNNSGHFFTFKIIPKNELWIDKDFSDHGDEELLILQGLYEIELFKKKYSWYKAVTVASKRAKKDRKKLNNMTPKEAYIKVHIKKLNKYCVNNIEVWLINGRIVRDVFYTDFTEGGHHYVYNFVPKDEVWIDDSLNPDEYNYVIFHEIIERNLMKYNKMKYADAHDIAIKYEGVLRDKRIDPYPITINELNRKK